MTAALTGGCRCGAVRYRLSVRSQPPICCCHCLTCQTWSGTAFTQQAFIRDDQIELTAGSPELYVNVTASGAESVQRLCGTCHTRLWNTNSARPGIAVVRAGTLDDSATLVPRAHIWTSRMQPWIIVGEGVPSWPENPPQAELMAALMKG